jgi:hypothetical protein
MNDYDVIVIGERLPQFNDFTKGIVRIRSRQNASSKRLLKEAPK